MAEHFRFFDAVETNGQYDREYNAQEFTDYFKALVTTGVMKGAGNQLAVTANGSNMVTSINTGIAFILGRYYENDAPLPFTHDTETIGLNRIDRIIIRMDQNVDARHVKVFLKKGTASTNPTPPALTQNNTVYEISLAQVRIVGGQTFIASNAVTDERGTDIICPWAGSRVLPNFDDSSIGQPNGIATLDDNGSVPIEQLQNVPLPEDATATIKGLVQIGSGINVSNGVISVPTVVDATTSRKGIVQLNNTTNSTLTTQAATANAVKLVYDRFVSDKVELGSGASAGTSGTAVGPLALTLTFGTAIGYRSEASGNYGSALGSNATSTNANEGVLGGTSATSTNKWKIPGTLSVTGTKNFEIPHPHPDKRDTHVIRHGAIESPTPGDTLYRYEVEVTEANQTVELQLPDYFEHLNANVDVWVNPHLHFGRAFGIVEGDKLKVTCETAGKYKALVIGTRNDDNVQDWYIKGAEREIGESWLGETYVFEVEEISEVQEITEVF